MSMRRFAQYLASWATLLRWKVGGVRAHARSSGDWDRQYSSGAWDFLEALSQRGHQGVIAGYALALKPRSILDVGCGQGALEEQLKVVPYRRLVGIDFSEVAIASAARHHGDDRTEFLVADAREFRPDQAFDLIIFNECLYYLGDPQQVLDKYSTFLEPGGHFIVSMYSTPRNQAVWHAVHRDTNVKDAVSVMDRTRGRRWAVELLTTLETRDPVVGGARVI